jgi:hypothetical protein
MIFELSIRFECGRLRMSNWSKRTAEAFGRVKDKQAESHALELQHKALRDEVFSRLRGELKNLFEEHCDNLNHEVEVGNILVFDAASELWQVTRTDTGSALTIKFDSYKYEVILKCETPVKFDEILTVKLKTGTAEWWYLSDKGNNLSNLSLLVERSLHALLGTRSSTQLQ